MKKIVSLALLAGIAALLIGCSKPMEESSTAKDRSGAESKAMKQAGGDEGSE